MVDMRVSFLQEIAILKEQEMKDEGQNFGDRSKVKVRTHLLKCCEAKLGIQFEQTASHKSLEKNWPLNHPSQMFFDALSPLSHILLCCFLMLHKYTLFFPDSFIPS